MKTNDEIESILAHLIEKLNRVEANVASLKVEDGRPLVHANSVEESLTVAINKLNTALGLTAKTKEMLTDMERKRDAR